MGALRTGLMFVACALVVGGCSQTPEGQAKRKAVLDGLSEMQKTPDSQSSNDIECVSERQSGGKVVTRCKDDPHAKALKQVSGQ